MSLRINRNLGSLNAQRNLHQVTGRLERNFARLSSGLRVERATDDPSGIGQSELMRARIRSLDVAARNAQEGQSLLKVADGAMSEVSSILIRMRELAMQSANQTIGTEERTILNEEFQNMKEQIDQLSLTKFNGHEILRNTDTYTLQVGVEGSSTIQVANVDIRATTLGVGSDGVATHGNALSALGNIDSAIDALSLNRGAHGASINRLEHAYASILNSHQNLATAESRIRDVDVANETAQLALNSIQQQSAVGILAQANTQPNLALQLLGS